jgi:hypothetical protein
MNNENQNKFNLDVVGEMANFSSPLDNLDAEFVNKPSIFLENTSTVEPIFETIKPYAEKSETISLSNIEDIESSFEKESEQVSDAAMYQESILNPQSSQEQIYMDLNTINSVINQIQSDLGTKADIVSNDQGVIQSRYQISSENVMFFDRLAKTNAKFSWA